MKSRNDIFETTCHNEFSFLGEFGFTLIDSMKDNFGCRLTYKNNTTGIKIDLDRSLLVIDCYKLKDGELPKRPIFFNPNDEFLVFDLNTLLILKTGEKIDQDQKLMYDEHYMKNKIKESAMMLKIHAKDILSGDFSLLPKIKERVIRRAKELENEQRL